jgi:TM2 domain-containing membrane protein YozV
MICQRCGTSNDDNARFCKACSNGLAPVPSAPVSPPGRYADNKKPWVAVVLSWFLPGLGQMYNADMAKGLLILVAYFVSYWMALGSAFVLFFLPLVVWIWGLVDAYKVAARKTPLWA